MVHPPQGPEEHERAARTSEREGIFGGTSGEEIDLAAGDVAVLPAGTGHERISASYDLIVVGAYPSSGRYNLCRGSRVEHARAVKTIPLVPHPESDPVYGAHGPLLALWARTA